MKKAKFQLFFRRAAPFLLVAVVFGYLLFPKKTVDAEGKDCVVRIWNVDTFEGGKGSRASFLKKVAKRVEKKIDGVFYLISDLTTEGAKEQMLRGNYPDMLSFGIGFSEGAEALLPLKDVFCGGELNGKTVAYPWCRGGYALFSLSEDFSSEGEVIISRGGKNLPTIAAAFAEIEGEELPSLAAYSNFLNGKYRYLLGTQRDLCRFSSRNVQVYYKPLPEYCDLFEYIGIFSSEKFEECNLFYRELLSDKTQSELSGIGMYSLTAKNEFLGDATKRTLGVFTTAEGLNQAEQLALKKENRKNLENILKII